ncbi:Nucleoside phosphorylase [Yoonia rosea]|uniref:Nucleoside phosphorylase n=1 Tax=Yoonia rosea TaxID=287098 RepID=A0A1R3WG31_9RHOB|nr:hypothetical protein [Yoonia rosea]SIT77151.1 Nucleoside phosphorylase [Yoonia rosea]
MRKSDQIKLLVVEDTPEKLQAIVQSINDCRLSKEGVIFILETATCFSEAQSLLQSDYFDAIILDLKIPVMPNGESRIEHSKELFEFVRDVAPYKPFYVLGLTSVPLDEVGQEFIETANFTIREYDHDGDWLNQLMNRVSFVLGAKSGLSHYLNNNSGLDALIITARKKNEYDPILQQIDWLGDYNAPRPELGEIRNTFGKINLEAGASVSIGVVCLDEMGLSHSAAVTAGLVSILRPRYLAMLGMCCGLKKIVRPDKADRPLNSICKLGDVIVARDTCCWDEGKYVDNDPSLTESPFFNNRAVDKSPDPVFWKRVDRFLDENEEELSNDIRSLYESYDLDVVQSGLIGDVFFSADASVHWGPIVSGACVIDSDEMIDTIQTRFPRAIGLEMEAHSIYSASASTIGLQPNTLVIKGVADFGDGTKAKPVQAMASQASYRVFERILREELCRLS